MIQKRRNTAFCILWPIVVCLVGVSGCCTQEPEGVAPDRVVGELRIASLSPAMTSMVLDLGLGEYLVGRTPYCRGIDSSLPVVGALDGIDTEIFLGCEPTLVLVQPSISGVDPALADLATENQCVVVAQHLNTLSDVRAALAAIAYAVNDETARDRSETLQSSIEAMDSAEVAEDAPQVALVYSLDPCGVVGRGTYLDEVLQAAGGRNAIPLTGWLEMTFEDLLRRDPDLVIFLGNTGEERLASLPWSSKTKVHSYENRSALEPSSRAPAVMQGLAEIIGAYSP